LTEPVSAPAERSALRFLPLVVFALLAGLFLVRLFAGDASRLPSALIGKPVPVFVLSPVEGLATPGFSSEDLRDGKVTVINVFASWCAPCRAEHSALMELAQDAELKARGVRVFGLSYKDEAANARGFLAQDGNPFERIGADKAGRVAIDFGVYGVPETFIVRGDGTIAYKFVGPLSAQTLAATLVPEIERAMKPTPPQ
jgi:cytochrome c biogenesis protein CcmG, thiol:disulfide interchange protein DsbE